MPQAFVAHHEVDFDDDEKGNAVFRYMQEHQVGFDIAIEAHGYQHGVDFIHTVEYVPVIVASICTN